MLASFEIGDFVQVKDWDEMKEEFGLDEDGGAKTPNLRFIGAMKYLCGQVFQVRELSEYNGHVFLRSVENIEERDGGPGFWYITPYMVKPVDDSGSEVEVDFDSWQTIIQ